MNAKLNVVKGEFIRSDSSFRNWITSDGSAGPSGKGGFAAEPGRYHLYVSHACPWAHRTMIFRALKGLNDAISVSVVHPLMPEESWVFGEYPGATIDHINGSRYLYENYLLVDPDFKRLVTVPLLWDKTRQTIVNNESSEIIRMLNSAFDHLFNTLDELEAGLSKQRYLVGSQITEADWRLFTTLVRFDAVYYNHFKTNKKRLMDYPNLWSYTRELYQIPGVAETVNMDHIKYHYFASHHTINPTGIVPKGPEINFLLPHDRENMQGENHV